MKKIVILSTSPRKNSNSNALAEEFAKGAKEILNNLKTDKAKQSALAMLRQIQILEG